MDEKLCAISLQAAVRTICPGPKPALKRKRKGAGTCFQANHFGPVPHEGPVWVRAFEAVPSHFCLTAPVLIQSAQSLG